MLNQNLDPNKAHGHDNVSIRMLKICGSFIHKPLEIIFKQCIETGVFPSPYEWKKANIVPIHKKGVVTYLWKNPWKINVQRNF